MKFRLPSIFQSMTLIRQSTTTECGLACVGMVASYYGHKTDIATLRNNHRLGLHFASLADLVEIGNRLGLVGAAFRCSADELRSVSLPLILHWNNMHFVVLHSIRGRRFTIYDPEKGKLRLEEAEFVKQFSGAALELYPNNEFTPKTEKQKVRIRHLLNFRDFNKKAVFQLLLFTIALQAFSLIGPLFLQLIIDQGVLGSNVSLVVAIAASFIFIKLFEILAGFLSSVIMSLISQTVKFRTKSSVFHYLCRLPLNYFSSRSIGDIQSRFLGVDTVVEFFTGSFIQALMSGTLALAIGLVLFQYNAILAMIVIIFVLFYAAVRVAYINYLYRLSMDEEVSGADESAKLLETIGNMELIKVSGIEVARESEWRQLATKRVNSELRLTIANSVFAALNDLLPSLSYILIASLAAFYTINGSMTIGMMSSFLAYSLTFQTSLFALLDQLVHFKLLNVSLDRLSDILTTDREAHLDEISSEDTFSGSIELRNVKFSYSEFKPLVLDGINLKIDAGSFVAITGISGGGKSTLVKLILGLEVPTEGEILFDGKPASHWGWRALRWQIGTVMQDADLLAGSIAQNISLFHQEPDMERVRDVAHIAAIDEHIESLPMGYSTTIGEVMSGLSGGQKQRVAIARALYRRPSLLVMDEGTSDLDIKTEDTVNSALRDLNMTRISVAHRPDTLKKADRVITIEGGKIVSDTSVRNRNVSSDDIGGPELAYPLNKVDLNGVEDTNDPIKY